MNSHVQTCIQIACSNLYHAAMLCVEKGEPWTREMDEAHRLLWGMMDWNRGTVTSDDEERRRLILGVAPTEETSGVPK